MCVYLRIYLGVVCSLTIMIIRELFTCLGLSHTSHCLQLFLIFLLFQVEKVATKDDLLGVDDSSRNKDILY